MNYAQFQKQMNITKKSICKEIYLKNRDSIRIKKEETVIRNLEKIFSAAMKIANRKGFQGMSMRDLSKEAGLSLGALYAYFASKDDLLNMMQHQRRAIVIRTLEECFDTESDALEKLETIIRIHLYLSEAMQPWFYFSFMEAKNLSKAQRDKAVASSRSSEKLIADIIKEGQETGQFRVHDQAMSASLIKAMLQDWYLNHRKYARRKVSVDQYMDFILEYVMAFLGKK